MGIDLASEVSTTVYVKLLDEGTDVWRPVPAQRLAPKLCRLTDDPTQKPDDEVWQFELGAVVRCEYRTLSEGNCLVAIEQSEKVGV